MNLHPHATTCVQITRARAHNNSASQRVLGRSGGRGLVAKTERFLAGGGDNRRRFTRCRRRHHRRLVVGGGATTASR